MAEAGNGGAGDGGGGSGGAAGGVGGGGSGGGAAPVAWTEGFDSDTLGYVQNKGWKGPADIVSGYRNFEKLHGVPHDQVLRLPKADDAEGWKGVWSKLGTPDAADKYEIPMPQEGGDENFAKWARDVFHKHNLTAAQARGVAEAWNEFAGGAQKQTIESYNQQVEADDAALKKEWGAEYENNVNLAKRAAQTLGLDGATVEKLEKAMGFAGLMKFTHTLGTKLGTNDGFVGNEKGGGGPGGPSTVEAAQARIKEMRADPAWRARWANNDHEARAELKRLHQIAYPGDTLL